MADRRMEDLLRELGAGFGGRSNGAYNQSGAFEQGPDFSTLFAPVDPYNRWPMLVPFVSVVGAAVVVMLTGVAAASLVFMSFALLLVVFLLSEVFGYEMAIPTMPR